MKQLLVSFTRYEKWANKIMLDVILQLSEQQQHQEIKSSFPSIHKTCLHIWDASSIWWQRVHGQEHMVVPSLHSHPTIKEIADGLLQQNMQWIEWVQGVDDGMLEKIFPYKTMKGDAFQQPVKDILLHLNNHGTYHRGQLVTMLRQVGVEKIPQTDYILYSRG
ncbi:MAG: DinB family protein [Bacteroidota bacterium]